MLNNIKKIYTKGAKNEFVKGVATLTTGTAVSQIIPLLIAPIIARLYNPSDYALLATYSSITILLTIIATGMYDSALMLDKNDENAVNTGAAAISITVGVTIISVFIMFFIRNKITRYTENNDVQFWLYLVPLTVFSHGIYQTLNVWNNRKGRYKRLAANKIIMTVITSALTLSLGCLGLHEKGLIVSLIFGQVMSLILLFLQTVRSDRVLFANVSKEKVLHSLKIHKDFPKYNMPQGFLDGVKESSLVWIISFFFGTNALGSFSFAKSILMRPLQIISSAVGQVFYQKASKIYNDTGNIKGISKKTFLTLLVIGFPFALIIFFWGETIFSLVFGSKWIEAGLFAQILIFWLLLSFVASPLSAIPLILKKQKQYFYCGILFNALPILVLYLICKIGISVLPAMATFAFSNILMLLIVFCWFYYILKPKNKIITIA
jgi:lipopolysaccharide exporter